MNDEPVIEIGSAGAKERLNHAGKGVANCLIKYNLSYCITYDLNSQSLWANHDLSKYLQSVKTTGVGLWLKLGSD